MLSLEINIPLESFGYNMSLCLFSAEGSNSSDSPASDRRSSQGANSVTAAVCVSEHTDGVEGSGGDSGGEICAGAQEEGGGRGFR